MFFGVCRGKVSAPPSPSLACNADSADIGRQAGGFPFDATGGMRERALYAVQLYGEETVHILLIFIRLYDSATKVSTMCQPCRFLVL